MKLAYPILYRVPPCKIMAMNGDFEENLRFIKSCGYDAIEVVVRDLNQADFSYLEFVVAFHGLEIAAVGINGAIALDGLTLINADPSKAEMAMSRSKKLLEFCARVNAPLIIGKFRGNTEDMHLMRDKISELAHEGMRLGATIVVEPQNPTNIDNLHSVQQTMDFISTIQTNNVGILYDFYHGDIVELDWIDSIRLAKDYIQFIHCSDRNRLVPTTGGLNIEAALQALLQIGYSGTISLEIAQSPSSHQVATDSIKHLKQILSQLPCDENGGSQ